MLNMSRFGKLYVCENITEQSRNTNDVKVQFNKNLFINEISVV